MADRCAGRSLPLSSKRPSKQLLRLGASRLGKRWKSPPSNRLRHLCLLRGDPMPARPIMGLGGGHPGPSLPPDDFFTPSLRRLREGQDLTKAPPGTGRLHGLACPQPPHTLIAAVTNLIVTYVVEHDRSSILAVVRGTVPALAGCCGHVY